ncbi:MAG: IclR family transcriptional regulator, partial [Rhodospirillales bacterium]
PKPTGHRIAKVLEEQGFLGREPGTRRFVEGQRLVELALKVLSAFAQRAPRHAILQALSEEVGETCNLGVLAGNQVVYLDRVEAVWPLGLSFSAGSRVPLHCTSIGKLLLSHQPRRQRQRLITSVPFKRYTENTITEPDRLMAELERIREHDAATDNQEFLAGVVCVAVPVAGPGGRICAGLAISAPEARLTLAEALRHVPTMRNAAARLSETLSAQETGPDPED